MQSNFLFEQHPMNCTGLLGSVVSNGRASLVLVHCTTTECKDLFVVHDVFRAIRLCRLVQRQRRPRTVGVCCQSPSRRLLARLKDFDDHLGPSVVWSSAIAQKIVKVIHNEAYGAVDGIMPRCGKPCPRSKCPCTKALGHVSTADDALHDTYHQPGGLTGGYWNNTNELIAQSCAICVVEKSYMVFTSGNRSYT